MDWNTIDKYPLSERLQLVNYIEELVRLSNEVENDGIAALETYKAEQKDPYMCIMIDAVCQGVAPEVMEIVIDNCLKSMTEFEATYLRRVIFSEFLKYIQKSTGDSFSLRFMLYSILGFDVLQKAISFEK